MSKRPTIADVARAAGVAKSVASDALNDRPGVAAATRHRVSEAARALGWRPSAAARALSRARSDAVGLVIARPIGPLMAEPFYMAFIAGIQGELAARHISLVSQFVRDHRDACDIYRRWVAERRVDGLILTDLWDDDERLPVVRELGVPAVAAGGPLIDSTIQWVSSRSGRQLPAVVDYLAALGHRTIAWVGGPPELRHAAVRNELFLSAARAADIDATLRAGDYSSADGEAITRDLLTRRSRPTAIVYDNDVMAVAALGVASELQLRVPHDVSLVAGEDSYLCRLVRPQLTALARDVSALGAAVARTLLAVVDGDERSPEQPDPPSLVVRASTAPPPPR